MIHILIRQIKHGRGAEFKGQRRVDAVTLPVEKVPVVVQAFHHGVEPERGIVAKLHIGINPNVVSADRVRRGPKAREGLAQSGLFGHAVEHTARAAPPEKQRIRTTEDLDLLKIVKRSIILNIVANTVDEKVSG